MNIDFIKLFSLDKLPYWMAFTVMVVILLTVSLIFGIPKIIENRISKKDELVNSRKLQIESYFRQLSGDKLQNIFSSWTGLFFDDMEKQKNSHRLEREIGDLIKKTIMFSSARTVKLMSYMQSYIYKNNDSKKSTESTVDPIKQMAYLSMIITSLKYDFSGYKIEPYIIMKSKITDFDDIKEKYDKYILEIEKDIR